MGAEEGDAIEAVGHDDIGGAGLDGGEGGGVIRVGHEGGVEVEAGDEFLEGAFLDGALEDGDALAVEIHEGFDAAAAAGIDLEPAGEDGFGMEGEAAFALGGEGHVGHEVDFAGGEAVEAFGPGARDIDEFPVFLLGDGFDEVHEDALGVAIGGEVHLGGVVVDADAEGGGGEEGREGQQQESGDSGQECEEFVH